MPPTTLRKKDEDKVASIAVYDREGRLLFGRRGDNGKWTNPGGHFEPGESPGSAATRELYEETGFEVPESDLTFLGEGLAGRKNNKRIYCFSCMVDGEPDSSGDPDEECDEWKWVDVEDGLPAEIANNLHSPQNITLRLLRLQKGDVMKSLKDKFMALAAGAAMATGSSAAADVQAKVQPQSAYRPAVAAKWTPAGLDEDLRPIAQLESSGGQRMDHLPHTKGEFNTAFGAVGFKPVTAHEEYKRTKWLQKLYPNLHEQPAFMEAFKTNPVFYNTVASAHWRRLKRVAGGDPIRASYAWRWGEGMMARTDPLIVAADPYVQAFAKLHSGRFPQVALKHTFESAAGDWLQKSTSFYRTRDGVRIPTGTNPERAEFDAKFLAKADAVFGAGVGRRLQPIKVEVAKLQGCNLPVNEERVRLYQRMFKAGDTVPPVVVQRAGQGFSLLDGNHRQRAAENSNQALLDAFEVVDDDATHSRHAMKIYDVSSDELGLLQPHMRHTPHGVFYEAADFDSAKKELQRLGYHGYRGAHRDPTAVTYFSQVA